MSIRGELKTQHPQKDFMTWVHLKRGIHVFERSNPWVKSISNNNQHCCSFSRHIHQIKCLLINTFAALWIEVCQRMMSPHSLPDLSQQGIRVHDESYRARFILPRPSPRHPIPQLPPPLCISYRLPLCCPSYTPLCPSPLPSTQHPVSQRLLWVLQFGKKKKKVCNGREAVNPIAASALDRTGTPAGQRA